MTTTKTIVAAVKAVEGPGRRIVFRASANAEDHMGDVLEQRGIDTSVFLKNPVLLANHDPTFILGRVWRLWIAPTAEGGEALMAEAEVLPAGTSARIDERWAAIQAGAANGISIGFIGKEMEQRAASGGRVGTRYTKTTLLEISSVSLPACPSCLIEQRAMCPHGACACDGAEVVVEIEDEIDAADARAVVGLAKQIVPAMVAAAAARMRGDLDVIEVDDDGFDPTGSAMDRALLIDAIRETVPALVRSTLNKLRGRIDDD